MPKSDLKNPPIPAQRLATIRRQIVDQLAGTFLSAKEISAEVGIPEKEVAHHLEHIRHSLEAEGRHLRVIPSSCKTCGFVFKKRERPRRPGKCPVCRGEAIEPPQFGVE